MLSIVQDNSVEDFLKEAGPLLYRSEAENSLMLGLCQSFVKNGQGGKGINLFRVILDDSTVGVAVQTPPYNMILSSLKFDELIQLANYMFDKGFDLPGVVGPAESAMEFSKIWSKMTGTRYELGMEQGIYKAVRGICPSVKGSFRSASAVEIDIVAEWLFEFSHESLPQREKFELNFAKEWASKAVSEKTAFFWVVDSRPVSVAHTGRPTKNGISIRAVYTPTSNRKNGFGSAVVASLTEKMINDGFQFCTLYTDLGNPTSNKIYQDVGYYEVLKSKHFLFVP